MTRFGRIWLVVAVAGLGITFVFSSALVPQATGQDKSKAGKKITKGGKARPPANTKNLDIKADQLASSFTRDAEELASQYIDAGNFEKARSILESALHVTPDSQSLKKKLEQAKDGQMTANEVDIEVNAARGWEPSGVVIGEGRPLRIRAEGSYKFDTGTVPLNAMGFPQAETGDLIPGVPVGALMGMIVGEGDKVGKPFLIGEKLDFAPRETGMLLLRINAPATHKSSGKLKVSISGNVQTN